MRHTKLRSIQRYNHFHPCSLLPNRKIYCPAPFRRRTQSYKRFLKLPTYPSTNYRLFCDPDRVQPCRSATALEQQAILEEGCVSWFPLWERVDQTRFVDKLCGDHHVRLHRFGLIVDGAEHLPNIFEFFTQHPSIKQNSEQI